MNKNDNIINGNDINSILKSISDDKFKELYNTTNRIIDSRFKYLNAGQQGVIYKLGNYVVKIIHKKDFSENETNIIKVITNHDEFNNFVKYYFIHKTQNYVCYVMNTIEHSLRKWFDEIHSDKDWASMLLQIIFSLYQMNIQLKIFHNDLQIKNIMYTHNKDPKKLIYNIDGKKYEIKTNYIFYITDLGCASYTNAKAAYVADDELLYTFLKKILTKQMLLMYKTKEDIIKIMKIDDKFELFKIAIIKKMDDKIKYKKMNKNLANEFIRKEIIYYALDNELIDMKIILDKITSPSKKIINLLLFYKTHNFIENINKTYEYV